LVLKLSSEKDLRLNFELTEELVNADQVGKTLEAVAFEVKLVVLALSE
jgi:hypothetical protein